MTDLQPQRETELELGGLQFGVSFRGAAGATLRVDGEVDGQRRELLRFDDFIEAPHYHVPADADPIMFDRELGAPLDWYIAQIRDHLDELLRAAGFERLIERVDLRAVADNADRIRQAMEDCVPEGFVRVPGVGLQRTGG